MCPDTVSTAQLWIAVAQTLVSAVLVGVTWWYVWLTNKISQSSNAAAEAARRSAELNSSVLAEMQNQRLTSSQPLIVAHSDSHTNFNSVPEIVNVTISNIGNGPALAVTVSLQLGNIQYSPRGEIEVQIAFIQAEQSPIKGQFFASRNELQKLQQTGVIEGQLMLAYNDIYNRQFRISSSITFDLMRDQLLVGGPHVDEISDGSLKILPSKTPP